MTATAQPIVEQHLTTAQWEMLDAGTPQHAYLHSWRRENLLVGGRGTRKSTHLLFKCAFQAVILNAGQYESVVTEQTARDLDDILIPRLKKFINPELYTIKGAKGGYDIQWVSGHLTRFRSRQARRRHDDPPFRGPDACWIGHDEGALDKDPTAPDRNVIAISSAMMRGKSGRVRCMDFTTTPRANWFYRYFQAQGVAQNGPNYQLSSDHRTAAFYADTRDVDPELYYDLISSGAYADEFADQELRAKWVPMQGRVWRNYVDAPYPDGNRWPTGFDRDLPWCLAVDLGSADSAWLLVQYHRPPEGGSERVAVVVAEWLASQLGSFHVIPLISAWLQGKDARYSAPFAVAIGHDLRTSGNRGDDSEMDFLAAGWSQLHPVAPGTWEFQKPVQHSITSRLILDTRGKRRFCVSTEIESFNPGGQPGRGIHDAAMNFTMPDKGSSAYFRKGAAQDPEGYCHVADAFCYLAATQHSEGLFAKTDRRPG